MNPRPRYDELPSAETEVSFVPMSAVEEESGRLDATQVRPLAAAREGYVPFKENDIVFAKITPSMENGKVAIANELKNGLAYGSTELYVFRPYDGLPVTSRQSLEAANAARSPETCGGIK